MTEEFLDRLAAGIVWAARIIGPILVLVYVIALVYTATGDDWQMTGLVLLGVFSFMVISAIVIWAFDRYDRRQRGHWYG